MSGVWCPVKQTPVGRLLHWLHEVSEGPRTVTSMLCQTCHRFTTGRLICEQCRRQLRAASDRLLPGGIRVVAAFEHSGPARALAHHLKYRGLTAYAEVVAMALSESLPRLPLVPIPRAHTRLLRYGIDPALEIARRLSVHLEMPVLEVFRRPLHTRQRAGGDHWRIVRPLRLRQRSLERVVLVDDVMTTGGTLAAAISAIGPGCVTVAAVANSVPTMTSLRRRDPVAQ